MERRGKSIFYAEDFMFQLLEHMFQELEHMFQAQEHKFQGLEHKIGNIENKKTPASRLQGIGNSKKICEKFGRFTENA